MPAPFSDLRFRWPWRPYQARLLAAVDDHLQDDRLHLVAAPGAGKTTLGLEVVRRLGRPALVLVPTLAIRDQWIRRVGDFLPDVDARRAPGWCSRDLGRPGALTVATYQAVLARHRDEAEKAEEREEADPGDGTPGPGGAGATLSSLLRDADLGTLVLDEAHHLRQEWWRMLSSMVDTVPGLKLVSLTATPPYDATGREWRRYEALCGPVDDEISVPELVKAGTLAPHQDFVLLATPTPGEAAAAADYDREVSELLASLAVDPELHRAVRAHPWMEDPDAEAVLSRPELAVALLGFLKAVGDPLPDGLLDLMELERSRVPFPDRRWWQVLVHEYLFGASFAGRSQEHRDALAARLRARRLLWRRELRIETSGPVTRSLALSAGKVEACVEIHRAERALRGPELRQVVLADFIRDEGWEAAPRSLPAELGALPLFDHLSLAGGAGERPDVALLTGRLSAIHGSLADPLRAAFPPGEALRLTPAPHRPGWLRVEGAESGPLVRAFTRLLGEGGVRVLVGTRSLLGEGWDAPRVNSVVLASCVGSFVSTNQMRGRGIRRDAADPDKVASIWHVAALLPDTPAGVMDLRQLQERFRTFVGLSADGATIESGFERLGLEVPGSTPGIASFNEENLRRHARIADVAALWEDAVAGGGPDRVAPTLRAERPPRLAAFHTRRTLRHLLHGTAAGAVGALGWRMAGLAGVETLRALGMFLLTAGAVALLAVAPRLVRAARLAFLHLPVDGSLGRIGEALLEGLTAAGLVRPGDDLRVHADVARDGTASVSLRGASFYEQTVFADAMHELLGPVENPRYLITRGRTGRWARMRGFPRPSREDVHAVPAALGVNRERAERFLEAWRRHVGPGELVFTRRPGGRGLLLAARARSFATNFEDPGVARVDRWS